MKYATLGELPATHDGALKIIEPITMPTMMAMASMSERQRRGRPVSSVAPLASASAVSTRGYSIPVKAQDTHRSRSRDDDVTRLTDQR
jgi:hypothetical protein